MDEPGSTVDLLSDPQVKEYFLRLVDRPLSAEEKYRLLIDFCTRRGVSRALVHGSGWEMEELLQRVQDSLRAAALYAQRSQRPDGGWGLHGEPPTLWHTGWTLLFLRALQDLPALHSAAPLDDLLRGGFAWLEHHPELWAADALAAAGGISVYEAGLMARCFYRAGRGYLRRETALRVYRGVERLIRSQNADGGWDASLWGYEITSPVRIWSETGATAAALAALAETQDLRFQSVVEAGMRWLAAAQNSDGSWNNGSCQPQLAAFQLSGGPSLAKTCDALQGLLAGAALEISEQPYRRNIYRAVDWLSARQQTAADGWSRGYSQADYERASLSLETLLRVPTYPLGSLAAGAAWLVQNQRCQPGDAEDGAWVLGHPARVALALTAFYQRAAAQASAMPGVP